MELREAICERHAADFGTSYTPSECMVSAGGKHALFNVLQSLLDPGDEVIDPGAVLGHLPGHRQLLRRNQRLRAHRR